MRSSKRFLFTVGLLSLAVSAAAENLSDVLSAADAVDPQWKATRHSFDAQREVLAQGRSGVLPSLVLSGEEMQNDVENNDTGSSGSYDSSVMALTLTQPLVRFDRWFTYQSARASRSRVDADYITAEQDYLVRVTETYLAVLRAYEQLAYTRAEEAALARQLEQAKQRFNVGLIAITDVHETQAAYDLAQVGMIVSQTDLSVARARLRALTGKQYSSLAFPGEDMPVEVPAPLGAEAWVEKAREGNAQLIAARHAARAAQQNARAATSGHLPNVDFVAQYMNNEGGQLMPPTIATYDTTYETMGIQFNWPLFAGGGVNSQRKQANFEYSAAQENLRAAEINATETARTTYQVVEADVARVKARKQAIVSAQSALDASNAGYEVGTRNIVDVLEAQRFMFAARRDYANARYDYILDLLRLHRAAGSLARGTILDGNKWLNVTLNLESGQPTFNPGSVVAPATTEAPASATGTAKP